MMGCLVGYNSDIMAFRKQIRRIYDLIGIDDIEQIKKQLISS
jgi:hypothetical protein